MNLIIEKGTFDILPNICVGAVCVEKIDNKSNSIYTQLLNDHFFESVDNADFSHYHTAFSKMGVDYKKNLNSAESLYKRVKNEKKIPSINTIVDICNFISLKYHIPVGAFDMDKLVCDLIIGKSNSISNCNEIVYLTNNGSCTEKWNCRQFSEYRVTEKTTSVLFTFDGFADNRSTIVKAIEEVEHIIFTAWSKNAFSGIVDIDHPCLKFSDFSEDELLIEQKIQMIIKGATFHSDIEDIRKKLLSAEKQHKPLKIKFGLDPSAPDIHFGHAVALRKIRQLQDLGFVATIVIGDFTGKIGDPSGKSKTRNALSDDQVRENAKTYANQVFKILDADKTILKYNGDWLSKLTLTDVVELASKCTVARILERDDFKNRYSKQIPIGLHEFLYPLMQAYDSVAIKSDIELGGTDQTFNVMLGRTMQKSYGQDQQLILLMPLLVGIDGVEKMSKSLGNYICIDENADVMYEKIMKIPDNLIINYFNLCTDLHPREISIIKADLENGANPRDVKMRLGREIVKLYHPNMAEKAEQNFILKYQKGIASDDTTELIIKSSCINIEKEMIDALYNTGHYKSKSHIRRLFLEKAVSCDGAKVQDINELSIHDGTIVKIGKGKFYKIRMQ